MFGYSSGVTGVFCGYSVLVVVFVGCLVAGYCWFGVCCFVALRFLVFVGLVLLLSFAFILVVCFGDWSLFDVCWFCLMFVFYVVSMLAVFVWVMVLVCLFLLLFCFLAVALAFGFCW